MVQWTSVYLYTIAEGMETEQQADLLGSANCHIGQGYYDSRLILYEFFLRSIFHEKP